MIVVVILIVGGVGAFLKHKKNKGNQVTVLVNESEEVPHDKTKTDELGTIDVPENVETGRKAGDPETLKWKIIL